MHITIFRHLLRTAAAGLVMAGLLTGNVFARPYVILNNGKKVEGDRISAKSDGTIVLQTGQGTFTYSKAQYRKAVADKPAEYDQARRAIAQGKHDQALALLKKIESTYPFLGWDLEAKKLIPRVLSDKGDFSGSRAAYEKVFREVPGSKKNEEFNFGYLEALMGVKDYVKLESEIRNVIQDGSREMAAKAQIMRGDAKTAQGLLEDAVMDYLRTVVFFKSQRDVHPQAIFKTAESLEKMKDERAKDFYRRVVRDYPNSEYAAKAKQRI